MGGRAGAAACGVFLSLSPSLSPSLPPSFSHRSHSRSLARSSHPNSLTYDVGARRVRELFSLYLRGLRRGTDARDGPCSRLSPAPDSRALPRRCASGTARGGGGGGGGGRTAAGGRRGPARRCRRRRRRRSAATPSSAPRAPLRTGWRGSRPAAAGPAAAPPRRTPPPGRSTARAEHRARIRNLMIWSQHRMRTGCFQ